MSSNNATARTSPLLVLSSLVPSSPPSPSVTPSAASSAAPEPSSAAPATSNPTSAAPPASSPAPAPSSAPPASSPAPAPAPSSQAPAPAPSSNPPANSPSPDAPAQSSAAAPQPSQGNNADTTQVVTAPPAAPTATEVQTSIVVITPSATRPGETPSVIIITSVITPTPTNTQQSNAVTSAGSARPSSSSGTELQNAQSDNAKGLSTGGKTAIAVVIPVVVVALLVLGGIFFWRKRKQRKNNEDERRKEVEEYGYNPNHDPTLPAVGGLAMAEDDSGYRGWGNTANSSNRKASTTLASGITYSDSNSNPGGYASPNSPTHGAYSDANSDNPLVNGRRETLDSDGIGALGVVNGSASNSANNKTGVHRGSSNASSSYSAANRSDNSGEYPGMPTNNPQEYYDQGFYQTGAFASNDPYTAQQQPIIRDVSARRNTRIEAPSVFPQQGNSGIAQNF